VKIDGSERPHWPPPILATTQCLGPPTVIPDPTNPPGPLASDDRIRSLRRKLLKLNRAPLPEERRESVRECESESARSQEAAGTSDAVTLSRSNAPTVPPSGLAPPASSPSPPELPPGSIIYRRDLPRVARPRVPEGGGICIPLEDLVAGSEVRGRDGSLYLIERPLAETEPEAADMAADLARACGETLLADLGLPVGSRESKIENGQVCFLDIETTGLGSTPVFLIGTLVWRNGELVCRQFLARTYAEEASILDHYVAQARRSPVLVSFNGKTFDLPYLRVRAAATGVPFHEPSGHLDLLQVSRRLFRGKFPDCKLQTLERYVCRRSRGEDIPGHDIPRAYHDFVRTGDAREIAIIVRHNQLDLITMAHLVTRIVQEHS